jgi:hypothetical protein
MDRLLVAKYAHITALMVLGCLGLFHLMIAPVMFDELSGRLIWYLSTDLGSLSLIVLNLVITHVPAGQRLPWRLCHVVNALSAGLGVVNLLAVPEPINIVVLLTYVTIAAALAVRDTALFAVPAAS